MAQNMYVLEIYKPRLLLLKLLNALDLLENWKAEYFFGLVKHGFMLSLHIV